jgi:radical SAM superfamily enzyme YgiQ (UPF0313 family)
VFLREDYRFSPHSKLDRIIRASYKQHLFRRPNPSLLTLASYLSDEFVMDYVDEQFHTIDFEKPYDIVAISIMTVNSYRGYEIADRFREKGSHVIIGGIHAALCPAEAKEHADTVVVGEGEEAWQKFLADFKSGQAQPYYYGGSMNLDEALTPRYDLLPNDYFMSPLFQKEVYTYQYSRGCPHRCNFCASSKAYGMKYRTKSVEGYIRGVEQAVQRASGECVNFFADDDVTIKGKTSKDLFDRMADYPVSWIGCADIAISKDTELLDKMAKSRCRAVIMGLESLDETILKDIDPFKAKYFKNYGDSIDRILDHGVPIFASFIVGFDGDTPETFERIYKFVTQHKIPMTSVSMLMPFPGTAIYDQMKRDGRLLYENYWDKCTGCFPLFEPKNMSIEEWLEGTYWINSTLAQGGGSKMLRM